MMDRLKTIGREALALVVDDGPLALSALFALAAAAILALAGWSGLAGWLLFLALAVSLAVSVWRGARGKARRN